MIKSSKTYTCLISGNRSKISYLQEQLELIENLSWFIFNLKQRFGINWWFNQKMLYHQCRRMFPELNSKIVQNFIRFSYLSKTCSRCHSRNTRRPRQEDFVCLDCDFQLNADLNWSRNIEMFYRQLNGLPVNLVQVKT